MHPDCREELNFPALSGILRSSLSSDVSAGSKTLRSRRNFALVPQRSSQRRSQNVVGWRRRRRRFATTYRLPTTAATTTTTTASASVTTEATFWSFANWSDRRKSFLVRFCKFVVVWIGWNAADGRCQHRKSSQVKTKSSLIFYSFTIIRYFFPWYFELFIRLLDNVGIMNLHKNQICLKEVYVFWG